MKNIISNNKKIFISVVVLISVFIISYTYAQFELLVEGNDNSEAQNVTTGTLSLDFTDGAALTGLDIYPGAVFTKNIKVTNTGTIDTAYSIGWSSLQNEIMYDELVYSYTCTSYSAYYAEDDNRNVEAGACDDKLATPVGNDASALLAQDVQIANQITHVYELSISFIDTSSNQNYNQGKIFGGVLNIVDGATQTADDTVTKTVCGVEKEFNNSNTLGYKILNDSNVDKNCDEPSYNKVAVSQEYYEGLTTTANASGHTTENTVAESGIYHSTDDSGDIFFYRGDVENNYLMFSGMPWRIVKINGDGSIRITLDGLTGKVKFNNYVINGNSHGSLVGGASYYNNSTDYDTGVGTGSGSQTEKEAAISYVSYEGSGLKSAIDTFYSSFVQRYNYHLADSVFCNDNGFANETGSNFLFNPMSRITDRYLNSVYNQTVFTCPSDGRYLVSNNRLSVPAATLSADEVVAAGASYYKVNNQFYLTNTTTVNMGWPTMSGAYWSNSGEVEVVSLLGSGNYVGMLTYLPVNTNMGVRPVINLKADTEVSGTGTSSDPYVVVSGNAKINNNTLNNTVVIGDSRVVGMSVGTTLPSNVTTIATGGATIMDNFTETDHLGALKTLLNNNPSKRYNIVLEYGINDMGYPEILDEYVEKYDDLLSYLPDGHKVYILNVFPVNTAAANFTSLATNELINYYNKSMYNYYAANKNVRICDIYNAAPQSDWNNTYLSNDGVHLTNAGAEFMLETIQNCVEED